MPSKIVVIDTNIWVSYFIKARLKELVNLLLDNDLEVLSSPELVAELTEVLSRPKFSKYLTLPIDDYVDFHRELVSVKIPHSQYNQSPDPKDNFLFDLGLQFKAKYLITGDKKLLTMPKQSQNYLEVISLTAFKALLKEV